MVNAPRTYCKQHEALGQAAEMRKADAPRPQWPGAERPNEGLYHTARWRKLRQEVLREIGHCIICGATERLQVHHITPPKGDEALFFDRDNLTVLCESCHARMTSAEAREVKGAKR
jgi:hypothetical protein